MRVLAMAIACTACGGAVMPLPSEVNKPCSSEADCGALSCVSLPAGRFCEAMAPVQGGGEPMGCPPGTTTLVYVSVDVNAGRMTALTPYFCTPLCSSTAECTYGVCNGSACIPDPGDRTVGTLSTDGTAAARASPTPAPTAAATALR